MGNPSHCQKSSDAAKVLGWQRKRLNGSFPEPPQQINLIEAKSKSKTTGLIDLTLRQALAVSIAAAELPLVLVSQTGSYTSCFQVLAAPATSRLLLSCHWGEILAVKRGEKAGIKYAGIPQRMQRLLIFGSVSLVSTSLYLSLEVRRPLGQLRRSLNAVDLDASSAPRPGGILDMAAWEWRLPSV